MDRSGEDVQPSGPASAREQPQAKLLEREPFLHALTEEFDAIDEEGGRTVLISGEAGIGKTSLVEHFARQHEPACRVLWGACEALFTPRPLGPVHDIACQVQGDLLEAFEAQSNRSTIFSALLGELERERSPTVVIVEDLHWGDEATLDLMKFLGRRIHRLPAMLVVTYRDDELGPGHPLRIVLGDLPRPHVRRLVLPPLTKAAVAALTLGRGRSPEDLYEVTGGNPFFVTEVVASVGREIPTSVKDAVLARVARLPAAAREVLELVSVVPGQISRELLDALLHPQPSLLEACVTSGMLRLGRMTLAFRHELARRTVEATLPRPRREHFHARVLEALLRQGGAEPARLVHHAKRACDASAVVRLAPEAARQAAAVGAHREAAAHYETALRFARGLPPTRRAELFEARSYECYLTSQIEEALEARRTALALWRRQGRRAEEGRCLRWMSRLSWFAGRNSEAERFGEEAVTVLEGCELGPELAMAYSNRAQLYMLASESQAAVGWGLRAAELAEQCGDVATVAHAKNNVGTALLQQRSDEGWEALEESLRLALKHGLEEHAARAYTNLACLATESRLYERAMRYLDEGIDYSVERDLDAWSLYMAAWRARARMEQGLWDEALVDAEWVLGHSGLTPVARIPALAVRSRISVRRGDADAGALLDEAQSRARQTGELQRIGPVAAACAEAAWLRGRPEEVVAEAQEGYDLARAHGDPRMLGELSFWMWRGGALAKPPEGCEAPYAAQMSGDWRAAADTWRRVGCLYEEAVALADGDEAAQFEALALFERLGAESAAELLRRQMQERGVQGVPRGPRPSTKDNPFGLTNRQLEVLELLTEGLTNKEIAARLFISAKTVDHHVSAVLAKLEVGSRTEAAALAVQHDLSTGL